MEEKIYKIMRGAGALNIVLGVISLVVGIAAGVLLWQSRRPQVAARPGRADRARSCGPASGDGAARPPRRAASVPSRRS